MNATNSPVLYNDGTAQITNTQATINGTVYPLSDIVTVSVIAPVLRREYGYVLAVVGLVLLVVGYLVWGVFLTPMLAGAVFLVAGIVIAFGVRNHYTVLLKHRDAQLTQLPFPERRNAEAFLQAFNQATNRRN